MPGAAASAAVTNTAHSRPADVDDLYKWALKLRIRQLQFELQDLYGEEYGEKHSRKPDERQYTLTDVKVALLSGKKTAQSSSNFTQVLTEVTDYYSCDGHTCAIDTDDEKEVPPPKTPPLSDAATALSKLQGTTKDMLRIFTEFQTSVLLQENLELTETLENLRLSNNSVKRELVREQFKASNYLQLLDDNELVAENHGCLFTQCETCQGYYGGYDVSGQIATTCYCDKLCSCQFCEYNRQVVIEVEAQHDRV